VPATRGSPTRPSTRSVREGGDGVIIDALDPAIMATVTENAALRPVAEEAAQLIGEALSGLQSGGERAAS
jgi:hypothetical protein